MATRAEKRFGGNLPQLQNLIKRDPITYESEYTQQLRQFESFLKIYASNPNEDHGHFDSLILFLAHVSHCYPDKAREFSENIYTFLKEHYNSVSSGTRQALCKGLMLLHKRGIVDAEKILPLFFEMLKSQDKHIRAMLSEQIVSMIKAMNAKHKNQKVNSRIQNLFLEKIKEGHQTVGLVALESVIHLYRKSVWKDQKAVNIIGQACLSDVAKLIHTALRFFTSTDESKKNDDDGSDSEGDVKTAKELMMAHRVGKKTNKRQKRLERGMRQIKKNSKKKKAEIFDFSALRMIYDPQGFAEAVYKKMEKCNAQFETKLLFMDFISRMIGIHKLVVLNFYPYVQRFLQPHQREVTKILLYAAQATHDMVPPDTTQPLVKVVADNFVAERNSAEVIAVGLNSIREMCARCPFAMTPELLQDLAQYRKYRNKNVVSAARSLVQLYRHVDPSMLKRKDRGKPTLTMDQLKLKAFGETNAKGHIEGAEMLPSDEENADEAEGEWESDSEDEDADNDDGEWVDVAQSDNEETTGYINPEVEELSAEARAEKAAVVSSTRFLTQKEFDVIKKQKIAETLSLNKGKKRAAVEAGFEKEPSEFVSLSDIERLAKKPKETKAEKVAGVKVAREDRGAFGKPKPKLNPHASTTNKQKQRKKNFVMLKQKMRGKQKRSFRDKQIAFRNALLKQLKRK
ncbi:protein SDA1 homolog [Paramacrobiotus metropolitanus]|uniref:protein SDA1 homolog n=1 Tax=Paramacrobiotus metropolitanus TaxID=2943436 RepID=UPI002445AEBA|nr:protein SDA1 homolog [Paramacrobiotus metropolitanus]